MNESTIVSDNAPRALPGGLVQAAVERLVMESSTVGQADPPEQIFIAPWGEVETLAGSFIVDQEAATATIEAFTAHGTDVPVDYEHQTLGGNYSSPSGQAPAAGWIRALSMITPSEAAARGGDIQPGLWARVEWTEEAAEKLRTRQYRYLSPVALVRRSDRRLIGLHSVALTNKPAIVGMRPLIASADSAARDGHQPMAFAAERLRGLLRVADSAEEGAVLLAAAERIELLESRERHQAASRCVAAAMSAGKLTAAQRDWAVSLAERNPAEFERWAAVAPVVVPLGRIVPVVSGDSSTSAHRAAESAARAEYRTNRGFLEKLCGEEAYVAQAVRAEAARGQP